MGHSIIRKLLSPFSGQLLVAGQVNRYISIHIYIYIYIYIYIPACFSHLQGSVLSYSQCIFNTLSKCANIFSSGSVLGYNQFSFRLATGR